MSDLQAPIRQREVGHRLVQPGTSSESDGEKPQFVPLGAYRVHVPEGAELEDAIISIEPGRTPTEDEASLALTVMNTVNRMKMLTPDFDARFTYVNEIMNAFMMGAVDAARPNQANKIIEKSVSRYCNEQLFPEIDRLVNLSIGLLMGVAILSAIIAGVSTVYQDEIFFRAAASFAFLHLGMLAGRYISLFLLKSEKIDTLADYDRLKSEVRSPFHGAWLDAIVAFCAVILFGSQLFNISIGEVSTNWFAEQPDQSLVPLGKFWIIAAGFGILIGLARSDFISRIKNLAKKSLE